MSVIAWVKAVLVVAGAIGTVRFLLGRRRHARAGGVKHPAPEQPRLTRVAKAGNVVFLGTMFAYAIVAGLDLWPSVNESFAQVVVAVGVSVLVLHGVAGWLEGWRSGGRDESANGEHTDRPDHP